MLEKFRGCLFGVLIGDCIGAQYEGERYLSVGSRLVLRKCLDKMEGPYFVSPKRPYTDDTAMTMAVANTLIDQREIGQLKQMNFEQINLQI